MAKRKVVKPRVERTRNAGTMTESMFWSMIRSALRNKSRWWKPITECKKKSRRKYVGPNKRQKFEYRCNDCSGWFSEKNIAVDHIIPAGQLNNYNDLPGFVERLFCESENLQCLCEFCHNKKTKNERKSQNRINR